MAATGFESLFNDSSNSKEIKTWSKCQEKYLRPEPRVRLGTQLGRNRAAHSCIDLSDGLADGIHQLCAASEVGAIIDADLIPVASCARTWFKENEVDPIKAALSSGEDYELLFTSPPKLRRSLRAACRLSGSVTVSRIGKLTSDRVVLMKRDGKQEPLPAGYEHFKTSQSEL